MAIVNEHMACTFFPNEDPIGKRIKRSSDPNSTAPWMTIVGVSRPRGARAASGGSGAKKSSSSHE